MSAHSSNQPTRPAFRSGAPQTPGLQDLVIAPDVASRLERLGLADVPFDQGLPQIGALQDAYQARMATLNEVKALLSGWSDRAAAE
jgi:hypothetical protein